MITVLVLVVGAVAGGFAFRALPGDNFAELDELDRTMFTQLSDQHDVFRANKSQIWTSDYSYDLQPLILARSTGDRSPFWKYAYLVNMSDIVDTSDMRKVQFPEEMGLHDVYVSSTFALNEWHLWLPGNFSLINVNTRNVLAFKYNADRFADSPPEGLDFEHFILHEAFHTEQQVDWKYDHGDAGYIHDYPFNDEHFQLLEVEFQILDEINNELNARGDGETLQSLGADLINVRLTRYEKWPQLRESDSIEAIEGTATYVEAKYREVQEEIPAGSNTFSEVFAIIERGDLPQSYLERDVFYSTGALLGLLLDEVEPTWKEQIEPHPIGSASTPFEILQEALRVEVAPSAEDLGQILNRYR